MVYEWSPGFHLEGKPQEVGDRIEEISRANGGGVTPEQVVDDARAEDSPLHPYFEWDDTAAASKYRRDQARYVIRSVQIRPDPDERRLAMRAFVSVKRKGEEEPKFVSVQDAMRDEHTRRQLLASAVREVQSWRQRYSRLQELARVFEQVDQLELPKSDETP